MGLFFQGWWDLERSPRKSANVRKERDTLRGTMCLNLIETRLVHICWSAVTSGGGGGGEGRMRKTTSQPGRWPSNTLIRYGGKAWVTYALVIFRVLSNYIRCN
jgi:hypothetical protein